ncbi:MAG: PHP domain-containing protein [Methanomicrobiaceae archaeon]|uniref:Polymerase/histidinol phosphatase N-terminal domain-containing protein n=1 Tax=hydrocarbon metagenome TaxID=938273 RepID=A0A0W8FGP8_9ZZZZ|nr:PHP domain-containing protein [Methanomicrobiaceae archaeon]MDD5418481.1 PHP domain-containing protein [Methanomicrobiaceae archaeon]
MPEKGGGISYCPPDIGSLRADGYYPVDMHLHTNHSDGRTGIWDILRYATAKKIGVAITDHNEIRGSLEAISKRPEILVIPGIELDTEEGPHLLFYFYTAGDLQDFFHDLSRERNRQTPGLPENLPVLECLQIAADYDCLRVAAHPYGYFGINRGVLKCVEKQMLPGVLDHIDGIEAICGGMMHGLNAKAIGYARRHEVAYTGGSDAHILSDVGNVVTAGTADTVEEFLDGIIRRENLVVGEPGGYLAKGATAGVIAWSFVPYSIAMIGARCSVRRRRASALVSSCCSRIPAYCGTEQEDDGS